MSLLATTDAASTAGGLVTVLVALLVLVFVLGGYWRVFDKAGEPGWAALIPIYNVVVLCRVVGRPTGWVLLLLVPIVNLIVVVILSVDLATSFGEGVAFAIGIILLPFVFIPLLGFGAYEYRGPATVLV